MSGLRSPLRLPGAPATRRTFAGAAVPLLLLYLATARYTEYTQSNDAEAVAVAATTLAATGSLTMNAYLDNQLWLFWNGERYLTNRFPGAIFLTAGFAWVLRADAGTFWVGGVAAAVTTAVAMGALAVLLARLFGPRNGIVGALVVGVATSTWGISSASMWTHGPNQLWLVLAMMGAEAGRPGRSGLWLGAALFTRPQLGVVSAAHGVVTWVQTRRVRSLVLVGAGTAVGLAAYLAYTLVVLAPSGATRPAPVPPADAQGNATTGDVDAPAAAGDIVTRGRPLPGPERDPGLLGGGYGEGPLRSLVSTPLSTWGARLLGTLFSPNRGVVIQSPWLVVAGIGAWRARRRLPPWARSMAVAGIVYLLVQLRLNVFTGGIYFVVYRLPIEAITLCSPALALGYVDWVSRSAARLRAFWVAATFSAGVQFFAAATRVVPDFPDAAQRQEEWTLLEFTTTIEEQPAVLTTVVIAFTLAAMALAWRLGPRLAASEDGAATSSPPDDGGAA